MSTFRTIFFFFEALLADAFLVAAGFFFVGLGALRAAFFAFAMGSRVCELGVGVNVAPAPTPEALEKWAI